MNVFDPSLILWYVTRNKIYHFPCKCIFWKNSMINPSNVIFYLLMKLVLPILLSLFLCESPDYLYFPYNDLKLSTGILAFWDFPGRYYFDLLFYNIYLPFSRISSEKLEPCKQKPTSSLPWYITVLPGIFGLIIKTYSNSAFHI